MDRALEALALATLQVKRSLPSGSQMLLHLAEFE